MRSHQGPLRPDSLGEVALPQGVRRIFLVNAAGAVRVQRGSPAGTTRWAPAPSTMRSSAATSFTLPPTPRDPEG
ncbi:MAG: hypothetical protein HY815_12995 [Candidatus Riflebacteria bacterium]|nr:hypothetical protein [Candidatus Riflebacteria bacterium]